MKSDNITVFRGYSGEIVSDIFSPRTVLSAVPVFALYVVCFGVVYAFSRALDAPLLLLGLSPFIVALAVGRFALSAREGALHAGFFHETFTEAEAFQFALRYLLTLLVVCLPQYVALYITYHRATSAMDQMAGFGMGMPFAMNTPGLYVLGGVACLLLFVLFVLTPSLCALFTTCTVELSEVVRTDIWGWIFFERGRDLLVLYSSLFGGMIFCALFTSLPFVLLSLLFIMTSPQFSELLILVACFAPLCVYPILLGRLCGAFVIGDTGFSNTHEGAKAPSVDESPTGAIPGVLAQAGTEQEVSIDDSVSSPPKSVEKDEQFKDFDPNTMLITEIPGRMKTSFVKPVEEPDDDPFSPQYDDQPPRHEKKSQPIFASEQVSAPSATPSQSHTQGETQFLELNMPPSEGFMRWVQVSLSGVPSVQEAYLVRKVGDGNTPVVYLGVGLQPGASFHEQREVLRVLSEQAANLPEADKANIILLNELNAGTIVDKGRLIFKK